MNPKLLIVTDLGLLKAYKLAITPRGSLHLDRIKTEALKEAHYRLIEKGTDLACRRASPTQKKWGAPVADSRNLKLETKRRLVKKLAQLVEELIQKNSECDVWPAAPREINYVLTSALLKSVKQRIETNLTLNLAHSDEKALVEYFAPPAFVKAA